MSDSFNSSNLLVDDEFDLDSISVTNEDLVAAEAECGFVLGQSNVSSNKSIVVGDPRTKYKPSQGFLSLEVEDRDREDIFNSEYRPTKLGERSIVVPNKLFTFGKSSNKHEGKVKGLSANHSSARIQRFRSNFQESDLDGLLKLKIEQETKMKTEEDKLKKIEHMLKLKKMSDKEATTNVNSNQNVTQEDGVTERIKQLAEQELEIKRQTEVLLKMQQNMLLENCKAKEKIKLDDQKKILELQNSVQNLQKIIKKQDFGSFQGIGCTKRSVKERIGCKNDGEEGFFESGGRKDDTKDLKFKLARKRSLTVAGRKEFKDECSSCNQVKKKSMYSSSKLPDDLVLTEITDQGPVKKEEYHPSNEDGKSELFHNESFLGTKGNWITEFCEEG